MIDDGEDHKTEPTLCSGTTRDMNSSNPYGDDEYSDPTLLENSHHLKRIDTKYGDMDGGPEIQFQKIESLSRLRNYGRKTSWSDESGQSLVEYMDEANREPGQSYSSSSSLSSAATKPIKSAMRPSTRAQQLRFDTSQCIPKGLGNGGLVMPSRPGGTSTAPNGAGHVSPEWGWYISTTPPTPDMYCNNIQNNKSGREMLHPALLSTESKPIQTPIQPVFPKTPKYLTVKASKGWPSVPL
eukprot:CAMPEP_0118711010 /NCGR_PEP_ID=MMETSP0800-20121206/23789_1 /TAXON_ID=210618 ORGANISM="Striatella unipunctata, Strain CCMP2910" /NCGR_SAMPLE_ID=MMETSP0800 /ASSEMBLY_ACC=CAM_ASM_000638 /LENGTH=239 /DNA_ID=CAMNT_0006615435 /DNA_START=150 /DNA_END=869 /DNA_ORIENTATION=-